MIDAILFTKPEAKEQTTAYLSLLKQLEPTYPHHVVVVDVSTNAYLKKVFNNELPRLEIGPFNLTGTLNQGTIETAFDETMARQAGSAAKGSMDKNYAPSLLQGLSKSDRFTLFFSKHYLFIFNLLVFFYVGLAMLAPVLMKLDNPKPASWIYKGYSVMCHQLAYRSFFMFGEQLFYPPESAGLDGYLTFEAVSDLEENDMLAAKRFVGNELVGYKMALCQRDVAIYLFILLFGILYAISGRKIHPIPWQVWIFLGIAPIGLDGVSQLVSQLGGALFSWVPLRESTPLLRVITGGMFGFFTAWFGYPTVEETVNISRLQLEKRKAVSRVVRSVGVPHQ